MFIYQNKQFVVRTAVYRLTQILVQAMADDNFLYLGAKLGKNV